MAVPRLQRFLIALTIPPTTLAWQAVANLPDTAGAEAAATNARVLRAETELGFEAGRDAPPGGLAALVKPPGYSVQARRQNGNAGGWWRAVRAVG